MMWRVSVMPHAKLPKMLVWTDLDIEKVAGELLDDDNDELTPERLRRIGEFLIEVAASREASNND